ncbi:DUF955 domain-containing protein [Roseibacillus persicicus]|uniref:IrrE N-terminal-like domain-containing protein n=1 Tax=Roseibacillus persicicus TaxID=454148 RepID=A0A918WLM5_9BACT|nr:DUF955 domain-containing protein [Roseibacillus persicicus]GHC57499.1 hypothetical protein GCM10007100_25580 [Roseibacillus persicicus]
MKARILKPRLRRDIKSIADRILEELGNPEPPLDLNDVCLLLELDSGYFTSESEGLLRKTFSRMKRAGKQLLRRPTLLCDAIKKFDLRALYIPDQKRILVDDTIPKPKHRWLQAHEIGHSILPWHQEMMLGDDELTPTVTVHSKMEAEANFAGGSLLFLGNRFAEECRDCDPSIKTVMALKKRYGNTLTTTLWRVIEHSGEENPLIGMIGQHPKSFHNEQSNFRHLILSPEFERKFPDPSLKKLEDEIKAYCWGNRGPLGNGEILLTDKNGTTHNFHFETFYNGYDALTLGVHQGEVPAIVSAFGGFGSP